MKAIIEKLSLVGKVVSAMIMCGCAVNAMAAEPFDTVVDLAGGSQEVAGLTGNVLYTNSVEDTTATLTVNLAGGEATFEGRIAGNIKVVKMGGGVQFMPGGNTYTGTTEIVEGAFSITNQNCLGKRGNIYLKGGTLKIAHDVTINGDDKCSVLVKYTGAIDVAEGCTFKSTQWDFITIDATLTKRGKGRIELWNEYNSEWTIKNAHWIIEEGDIYSNHHNNVFGKDVEKENFTIELREGTCLRTRTHAELPNIVLRGGQLYSSYMKVDVPSYHTWGDNQLAATTTPINVFSLSSNKTWNVNHVKVAASSDGTPSVIKAPWVRLSANGGTIFDIDEGAELQIDAEVYPGLKDGVEDTGRFIKTGKGTLKFLNACNFKGTVSVMDGEIVFTKNAWVDPGMKFQTSGAGKVRLEDGAYLDCAVVADSAFLSTADIWFDATKIESTDGAAVNNVVNYGTAGGLFKKFTDNTASAPTYVAEGINGNPALAFNGSQGLRLLSYTNETPNITLFMVTQWTNDWDQWGGTVSFDSLTTTDADNTTTGSFHFERPDKESLDTLSIHFGANATCPQLKTGLQLNQPTIKMVTRTQTKSTAWSYLNDETEPATLSQTSTWKNFNVNVVGLGTRLTKGGSSLAKRKMKGWIGEMLVFTRELSENEIAAIQSYLKRKWFNSTAEAVEFPQVENQSKALTVAVDEGAEAAFSIGSSAGYDAGDSSASVVKMGSGSLVLNTTGDASTSVTVKEGSATLAKRAMLPQAEIWMDAADESSVTLSEDGKALAVRNKGRVGGSFVQHTHLKTVNCPTYLREGMNNLPVLDFDSKSALTMNVYTNKGKPRDLHVYTVLYKNHWPANNGDGVGAKWGGAFSMGAFESTATDNNTAGSFHIEHLEKYPGWAVDCGKQGMSAFDRAFTNMPYLLVFHTTTNVMTYAQITAEDDNLVMPICAQYDIAIEPLNVDTVLLGGRLGNKDGCPQINGHGDGNRMWRGQMGEFIVFDQKPTVEQEQALVAYLRKKWFNKGDGSTEAPICLTGYKVDSKMTDKTSLTLEDGATLTHEVAAQVLASLDAGAVTWNRTTADDSTAAFTLFNVAGDVNVVGAQTLNYNIAPKETATMFGYGGICNLSEMWTLNGPKSELFTVKNYAGEKRVKFSRANGTIIFVR